MGLGGLHGAGGGRVALNFLMILGGIGWSLGLLSVPQPFHIIRPYLKAWDPFLANALFLWAGDVLEASEVSVLSAPY